MHASRSQPTGVALIWVERSGQNSIVVASGANGELHAADVEAMRGPHAGLPVWRCSSWRTPLETVTAALLLARQEGLKTMLDPAPAQPLSEELLRGVDILTPNESEACVLLGEAPRRLTPADGKAVTAALRALGPAAVILKLGDQGAYYCDSETEVYAPGFAVTAKDTTAAGDTFNAALAVALAEEKPIAEALRFANAAAAISVTRAGAQASIPTRAEVDEFLSRNG